MEFLNQIWTAWNEQWGATIATILGVMAIAMSAGDRIHRLSSTVARWKGWTIARRLYQSGQRKYQIRRATNAMFAHLKQTSARIPIGTYTNCLAENPLTSRRNALSAITPEKPSFLNDHLVATALEALHSEGKIAKAELYQLSNTWPPHTEIYFFMRRDPGKTIEEQAEELESESRCRVEQFQPWRDLSSCSEEPRYETTGYAETMAPGNTNFSTRVTLKPDAPPCARCWEKRERDNRISSLVDSITKYDLAPKVTTEIAGRNQEFREAIIAVCTESSCSAEASTVRKIVEEAITIRQNQVNSVPQGHKMEWTEQLTADFTSSLSTKIRAETETPTATSNTSRFGGR